MKMRYILSIVLLIALLSCNADTKNDITVLVKYKTLPNKNVDALVALKNLSNKVENEDHFKKIDIYVDPKDNSNILLYEVWDDETYYNKEHMQTEHLQKFITDSRAFLAAPPQITFWRLNASYK